MTVDLKRPRMPKPSSQGQHVKAYYKKIHILKFFRERTTVDCGREVKKTWNFRLRVEWLEISNETEWILKLYNGEKEQKNDKAIHCGALLMRLYIRKIISVCNYMGNKEIPLKLWDKWAGGEIIVANFEGVGGSSIMVICVHLENTTILCLFSKFKW